MVLDGIQKYYYDVQTHEIQLSLNRRKDTAHGSLRRDSGVTEPKWHSCELEEAIVASECRLIVVF